LLKSRTPEDPLYRIVRGTKPWEFTDWSKARTDPSGAHTFGNRFDDPNGEYRVLYAASQLTSCYVETLARFRPDQALLAELKAIKGEDDFQPIGVIPREWFESRFIGTADVKGKYAELYTAEWVAHLRPQLQPECVELGLPDFDLSVLMQAQKRFITQLASSVVYDLGAFAGIYYVSRYGVNLENWALFEFKADIYPSSKVRPVSADDPALQEALDILTLEVPRTMREESAVRRLLKSIFGE
jgi:hypothetical protein